MVKHVDTKRVWTLPHQDGSPSSRLLNSEASPLNLPFPLPKKLAACQVRAELVQLYSKTVLDMRKCIDNLIVYPLEMAIKPSTICKR